MKRNLRRALAVWVITGLAGVALSGCGSDNATGTKTSAPTASAVSGSVAGAGASSQEAAMKAWVAGFQGNNKDAKIAYDPVGSGAGISQFLSKQVAWAGSDEALGDKDLAKAKERCGGADALDIPVYISPVVVVFNLPEAKTLNLNPATIAKIFRGDITKWNDPAIAATNPTAKLPDLAITPVHRADKSGTTENFTDYLHAAAPMVWTDKPSKSWPISGGESGDKTSGLIQVVQSGKGTIGYADASQVGQLGTVALLSGDSYVPFSAEAAAKSAQTSPLVEGRPAGDLAIKLDRIPKEPGTYPLVLVSYAIVCSAYSDKAQGDLVKAFLSYVVSPQGQQAGAGAAGSAPITAQLHQKIAKSLESIKVG